mmetsp:Transcript_10928/g.19608  ORF Transcript_10928/g.19608 Transcript_10928/m.19608 type:complete len:211 (-) Transcript_10928:128-760(-)
MLVSVLVLVLTLPTQIISNFSDFFFLSSCYRKCGKDCHVHVAASVVAYMTFENGGSGVPSFPFLKTILSQSAPVQKRFLSVPFFFFPLLFCVRYLSVPLCFSLVCLLGTKQGSTTNATQACCNGQSNHQPHPPIHIALLVSPLYRQITTFELRSVVVVMEIVLRVREVVRTCWDTLWLRLLLLLLLLLRFPEASSSQRKNMLGERRRVCK